VALSYLRVEPDFVVFRRWPLPQRRITRADVEKFEVRDKREDGLGTLVRTPMMRLSFLALLTKDGRVHPVPSDGQPVLVALRLNNELLR
jgi:hypothetical protein